VSPRAQLVSVCLSATQVEGIEDIHELHVWQLTATRIVGTIHIRCRSASDFAMIAVRVKQVFHDEGIHSVTVQPEFVAMVSLSLSLSLSFSLSLPSSLPPSILTAIFQVDLG